MLYERMSSLPFPPHLLFYRTECTHVKPIKYESNMMSEFAEKPCLNMTM